jgi:hypothetical protein
MTEKIQQWQISLYVQSVSQSIMILLIEDIMLNLFAARSVDQRFGFQILQEMYCPRVMKQLQMLRTLSNRVQFFPSKDLEGSILPVMPERRSM